LTIRATSETCQQHGNSSFWIASHRAGFLATKCAGW
jgi:site-specific recombinase XerC